MRFGITTKTNTSILGGLKLARLLEMPEKDFEEILRKLEKTDLFGRLKSFGVLSIDSPQRTHFLNRRFSGFNVKSSSDDVSGLINGNSDTVALMQKIGEAKFKTYFLSEEKYSDEERGQGCDIAVEQVRKLREFMDEVYVQEEFTDKTAQTPLKHVCSAVAGIEIKDDRPMLGFFHRDIWKGAYKVNSNKFEQLLREMPINDAKRARQVIKNLEFYNQRKTTLYRVLEALLEKQKDYLVSGDPMKRKPFTQRELADDLDVDTSVLNRLISNKSIQLPWGFDAPIKTLLPSTKTLMKENLYGIAKENPELSDEKLRGELKQRYGIELSRRSIAQYRKELGIIKPNS
ncbi:hypothetical protein ACFL6Y_05115 [Elusimicrobiota bacterium]